jgi:hypothetical protein
MDMRTIAPVAIANAGAAFFVGLAESKDLTKSILYSIAAALGTASALYLWELRRK